MKRLPAPLARGCLLILFAAVAVMTVASCAKERTGPSEQKVQIRLTAGSEPLKTYIGRYGDGDNVLLWGKDEHMFLSVLPGTGDSFLGRGCSDAMSASEGKPAGEFTFYFTVKTSPSYMYAAIYPASAMNEGNMDPENCRITLPIIQNPAAASYDPKACILQAKPAVFSSVQSRWTASFRRAAAINKLTLTNLKEGVKTVYITAPGHHLAGVRSMNLATGFSNDLDPDDTPVNIRYDVPLGAGTADVWFCSWGTEIPEGEKLVIMASTGTKAYIREIAANSKGISLKEGCLNCLAVDMSKATETDVPPDDPSTRYWEKDYSGKIGFQEGTLPAGGTGMFLAGEPVYLFGANCYNLFTQIFHSAEPSRQLLETTVGCLADAQVPVVRFSVVPFAPGDLAFYFNDREGFLSQLDYLASLCDNSHILLIPSIFWRVDTMPLYFKEPRVAWGDAESSTHKTMISFATDVVNTLKGHRCIAAWEFGNEYNLIADLGFTGREQVPATCIRTAYKDFADLVVSLDGSGRMICSGNSIMRNAQWHLFHEQNWTVDSYGQYVEMSSVMTPDPMKGMSEHIYGDERKFSDKGTCTLAQQLQYAKTCAASLGKAYYVGEFTGPESTMEDYTAVTEHFKALYEQKVQLSLIWCFSLEGNVDHSFAAGSPEAEFAFGKIREYNRKFRESMK